MRVRRGAGNEPLQGSRAEIDAIGKGMLAIGGSIAVVAVPLVALVGCAFVFMLSLGFADDPGRVAAEEQLTMLLVVGVIGAIVVALILAALCVPPVLMTLGSALRLLARVRPGITLPDDLD